MLARLKAILGGEKVDQQSSGFARHQIAAAALLAEAAALDGLLDDRERAHMESVLARFFNLSTAEAKALVSEAIALQENTVELSRFTSALKQHFDNEERIQIVEMLWEIVYIDEKLHAYEDNLMRRIGGLLHVEDRDRALAKQRALARLSKSPQ